MQVKLCKYLISLYLLCISSLSFGQAPQTLCLFEWSERNLCQEGPCGNKTQCCENWPNNKMCKPAQAVAMPQPVCLFDWSERNVCQEGPCGNKTQCCENWPNNAMCKPITNAKGPAAVQVTPAGKDSLLVNTNLGYGKMLCSANKKFKLVFQTDGNLCIYKAGPNNRRDFMWCNMKYNFGQHQGSIVRMQDDGNLVVYKDNIKNPVWATNTHNNKGTDLKATMQNDGNFVVYKGTNVLKALWASGTYGHTTNYSYTDCN